MSPARCVYDAANSEFSFRAGPVFTNILLADEINRTPPKTQASLLEAMEERQVPVDGVSRPLPVPFIVAATQNPMEYEGTYPLPEAQLDRFLLKLTMPLPDRADEIEVVRGTPPASIPATSPPPASARWPAPRSWNGHGMPWPPSRWRPRYWRYIVDVVRATRGPPRPSSLASRREAPPPC